MTALRNGCFALVVLVHAHLVASFPSDGARLPSAPRAIRLVFSEPMEAALGRILVRTDRDSLDIPVLADPADSRVLIARPPPLDPGDYRVEWQAVAADGHSIAGSYRFAVLTPGRSLDPAPSPAPPAPERPAVNVATDHPQARMGAATASATLRGLGMFALLVLAGWLIQLGALRGDPPARGPRVAAILALAATLLLAAHFGSWLLQVTPPGRPPDLASALRTVPGRLEALRVGLALLCLAAIWLRRAGGILRRPWVALSLALAAVLVSGATGHPASILPQWSIPLKALHLLGVAAWMGGVAWLAIAALTPHPFRASAVRVSGMALGAVIVVALTGLAQAALFLPGPAALASSAYGRLVLAKVGGLAALVAFGAYNRRRLLPVLAAGGDSDPLRRSTRCELALMLAITLLAGVLAYVSPPPG